MAEILEHLAALRVFESVTRLGSVRLAASELGVTDGAVSKQIRALETALNTELFIRGHRRIVPTAEAERLAATLAFAFKSILRAGEQLERASQRNAMVIAAPSTFLIRWLLPRLPELERRSRGTEINVVTWNKDIAATDRSIDIHITVGQDTNLPGMTREIIGPETFGPTLSPAMLPPGAQPEDILSLRRLAASWPPTMWGNWSTESGHPVPPGKPQRFERLLFAIKAAEAGLGVVLAPGPSVWDAIRDGTLIAPFGLHRRDGDWALTWRSDQTSGLHLSILNWFRQEFAACAPYDSPRHPADS